MLNNFVADNPNPRIFCVGRNYLAHTSELKNAIPDEPIIFIKPFSCLVTPDKPIIFPEHGQILHHEVEVVVQLGQAVKTSATKAEIFDAISAIGLGIDLTLRDVQDFLKAKQLPWEKAKAFENSAPIGPLKSITNTIALDNIHFCCYVNDILRQEGNTKDMLFSIPDLIQYINSIWRLLPGDLIFTGTPAGVAALKPNDVITIRSDVLGEASWDIQLQA